MNGSDFIQSAIRQAQSAHGAAVTAFLTSGFPCRESWREILLSTAGAADLIEVGVPFSDPMADGVTVQRSSREALRQGVTLPWILEELTSVRDHISVPIVLMSYLNPLLAFGWDRMTQCTADAGVSGFIIPDLPLEEQEEFRPALDRHGLALIQMVTPITPPQRLQRLCRAGGGFIYAVTVTGVTGGAVRKDDEMQVYLNRVCEVSPLPVLAGFGVRCAVDVARLCPPTDGVVVGSALIEAIERGIDPHAFLSGLRQEGVSP